MSPDQIQGWLDEVDSRLATVQAQIEPLLTEQSRLQDRRALLKDLLASFGDGPGSAETGTRVGPSETTRERVHRQAVDVFTQAGRTLHSNELHSEFQRRGYEIPGAGKPNNITVHLVGWPDIASPERGFYGLAEHVDETPKPSRPKRRRKRSVR